ncbi:MAG: HAD family hydrolase [Clostridia bacterium]|nr:HAD family hydrolase [Clostridia bacterium]
MKAILFDMDGTLLPLDLDVFVHHYFKELTAFAATLGFSKEELTTVLWRGIKAMIKNDGGASNAARFWEEMRAGFPDWDGDTSVFDRFYETEFDRISAQVTAHPTAAACIAKLKEKGYRLILATNPVFPESAQHHRLRWAGLDPADFEWITHFENAHFCKPNPAYYREILSLRGLTPADCAMVGNDVEEDMEAARAAGIDGWLLTDLIINRKERDLSAYPHGHFDDLYAWICALPDAS